MKTKLPSVFKDFLLAGLLAILCFSAGIAMQIVASDSKEEDVSSSIPQSSIPTHPPSALSPQVSGLSSPPDIQRIDAPSLQAIVKEGSAILIDVRDRKTFQRGHIPGACNYPLEEFQTFSADLVSALSALDDLIVLYCGSSSCRDSQKMAQKLADSGIPDHRLKVYKGGWLEWARNRGAIETGAPQRSLIKREAP